MDVREILEDDELLQAFAEHLQLKRLELRRCEAAAADFRSGKWTPAASPEDSSSPGFPIRGDNRVTAAGYPEQRRFNDSHDVMPGLASSTPVGDTSGRSDRLFRTGSCWARGRGSS